MNTTDPDQLFEDFFVGLKNDPSEDWIVQQFSELCNNGFSKKGILQVIKDDLSDEIYEKTKNAVGHHVEDSTGSIHSEEELVGVGGWLAFFCLALVVFSPVRNAFLLYTSYTDITSTFNNVSYIFFAISVPVIALVLFGMYCGIQLWLIRKNAVKLTKIYLITYIVVNTLSLSLVFLGGFTAEAFEVFTSQMLVPYLQACGFFGIWFSYLKVSKRVANTYASIPD